MDDMVELPDQRVLLRGIDLCLLLEDGEPVAPDRVEEEISQDISGPSEDEDDPDIEDAERGEKGPSKGHEWSFDDHEPEHDQISSRLEGRDDSWVEVVI